MRDANEPMPQPASERSAGARAAEAAVVMAAGLRLGAGLPSLLGRHAADAIDAVAKSLREGQGSDSVEAVEAMLAIVPAPAGGIMRLAAAGADVRRLLSMLDQMVAEQRRDRWETLLALCYPAGICLLAAVGIAALAFLNDPLINTLSEPIAVARPDPTPTPRPVWDAIAWPVAVVAAVAVVGLIAWRSRSHSHGTAARGRAAVNCELMAILDELSMSEDRRERIVADLAAVAGSDAAGPTAAPFAAAVRQLPAPRRRSALREAAAFYRGTATAESARRTRWVPVLASMVGGLAVLLYGIALFRPLVRLFESIAAMPVAPPWSPGS